MPINSPSQSPSLFQELSGLIQSRQFKQAKLVLDGELKQSPNNPELWLMLSSIKGQENDMEGVIECCERVISINPEHPQAYSHLGSAYAALGKPEQGIEYLERASQINPNDVAIHNNLGAILHLTGRNQEAVPHLEAVTIEYPNHLQGQFNLANAYVSIGEFKKARQHFNETLRINPAFADAYSRLGFLEIDEGNLDAAEAYFNKALTIEPQNSPSLGGIADVRYRHDDIEGAYKIIRPLIDNGKASVNVAYVFSEICKHFGKCDEARAVIATLLERESGHHMDKSLLWFALGKLNDAAGNYNEAFNCYKKGNDYSGQLFDIHKHEDDINRIIESYSSGAISRMSKASQKFTEPVFIIGMPRSGTSLTEQIVASHPDVYGAGELTYIPELTSHAINLFKLDAPYPEYAPTLTVEQLNKLAEHHIERLKSLSHGENRITDKLPGNYQHLGLISQVFPNAKIIHCTRDPMDTCLSIYFQNFRNSLLYSSKLEQIAFVYNNYKRLMLHWQQTLEIPILTVDYSDLVTQQEETTKEIVAFSGLDWNERCLDFHQSSRRVKTASYDQVRQPIYTSSLERWRNYEKHLNPLKNILQYE